MHSLHGDNSNSISVCRGFVGLLFLVKSNCDLNSDYSSEIEERRLSVKRGKKGFSSHKKSVVSTKKSVQTYLSESKNTVAYVSDSSGVDVCVKRR